MGAFATGFQEGLRESEMGQQQKQAARDLLFQNNFDKLQNDEKNIQLKYSSTLDKAGKPTADSQQWVDALAKNHADQRQLYDEFIHPATNPGALQRLGGWIAGRLHITHPAPSVTTEVGAITIPGTPAASSSALNPYQNPEAQPPTEAYAFNKQWAKTGPYATKLSPEDEAKFQQWAKDNKIPWQDSSTADYDMRGYWKALTDPNDPNHVLASRAPNGHFPDKWKTPYSGVFSRESMYAMPGAPEWKGEGNNAALYTADGRLVVGAPQSAAEGTSAQGAATPSLGTGPTISLPGQKVTVTEVPQKQYDKQQALQAKNLAADREAAQQAAAGAPIGPLQESAMKADAANEAWLSLFDAKMKQLRQADPNMSPEEAQRATLELMGVRVPLSYGQPQMWNIPGKGPMAIRFAGDGSAIYASGAPVDPEDLNGATLMPKPSPAPHTILNQEQDAYAKSYGFGDFSQLPQELQYAAQQFVQQQAKLATEFGRATRSTSHIQDIAGNIRAFTVWNYSTPNGIKHLTDPLSGVYVQGAKTPTKIGGPGAEPSGSSGAPTAPPAAKGRPAAPPSRREGGTKASEPSSPYAKVGPPIVKGRTPATDLDFKNARAARAGYEEVLKEASGTTPVDSQDMVMTWLKGRVNRVTATEIQAVRNLGGVFEKFDGYVNSVTRGTMSPEQISWFVKSAKERAEVAEKIWQEDRNQGAAPPPDAGIPKGATHKILYDGQYYWTDNDGNNLGPVTQ